MNWLRLYATFQIWFTLYPLAVFGAGCWTVVVIGVCRKLIGLSDRLSVFAVGLPFFIVLLVLYIRGLPKALRKANMLSDEPEKFGPWFKP
jgi:hypothetical protein